MDINHCQLALKLLGSVKSDQFFVKLGLQNQTRFPKYFTSKMLHQFL